MIATGLCCWRGCYKICVGNGQTRVVLRKLERVSQKQKYQTSKIVLPSSANLRERSRTVNEKRLLTKYLRFEGCIGQSAPAPGISTVFTR